MGEMLEHGIGLGGDRNFLQAFRRIGAARHLHAADIVECAGVIEIAAHAMGISAVRLSMRRHIAMKRCHCAVMRNGTPKA
jgi:hypothetical protein